MRGWEVWIRGGSYYISETIELNENDSGESDKPIVYTAYPGEDAEIVGGEVITGWELDSGSIYKVYLDDVDNAGWTFEQLFENGERALSARIPNTGYFYVASVTDLDEYKQFKYTSGDIPTWTDYDDAQVCFRPGAEYLQNIVDVNNINFVSRVITLEENSSHPIIDNLSEKWADFSDTRGNYYFIQNVKDELDTAGEFYLDTSTGYLYYQPKSTPIADQTIIAPRVTNLFEFKGANQDTHVQYIELRDLALRCAKFTDQFLNEQGSEWNGKTNRPSIEHRKGIIRMENASYNTIRDCKISNGGYQGVAMASGGECFSLRSLLIGV